LADLVVSLPPYQFARDSWGGTYAWADTDALAVVSNAEGGTLKNVPGCERRRILPRSQMQEIIDRFAELNSYDFGGSILRFLDCNYIDSDPEKGFRMELQEGEYVARLSLLIH
jgi:hypothetical protein